MAGRRFDAVVAAAEPIERRPESAIGVLRELAGNGRIVLFGHPTLEPLVRKMLKFGADDYVVTPVGVGELRGALGPPRMRVVREDGPSAPRPRRARRSRHDSHALDHGHRSAFDDLSGDTVRRYRLPRSPSKHCSPRRRIRSGRSCKRVNAALGGSAVFSFTPGDVEASGAGAASTLRHNDETLGVIRLVPASGDIDSQALTPADSRTHARGGTSRSALSAAAAGHRRRPDEPVQRPILPSLPHPSRGTVPA